ncbi:hypothetical protein ALC62_07196 [Cyphomyrmex costatus]|uniref:MADF domain-containing protein n=2 Tax=Cyphomyrmex costatus TaxID=456900 RepID=A0A151IHU7_9HYME|nr:hypothetical protein ALC62_07196 [Cyphomyrmex costatus]
MKQNSWREISGILNLSIEICQNRWIRLRDRFSREKRLRETETRSGSGATHRSGFLLYNNMLFLENHVKRRKSYTNVPSSAAKKQLMDISNTSSCNINISTSNILTSCQTLSNVDTNNSSNLSNLTLSKSNIQKNNTQTGKTMQPDGLFLSLPQCETNEFSFTNETITEVWEDSLLQESVSRDSVPRDSVPRDSVPRDSISRGSTSRDSVPRDSISTDSISNDSVPRDSVPRDLVPRDLVPRDLVPRDLVPRDSISTGSTSRNSTPSPANRLINTGRLNKKNKSNSYLEQSLVALSDSLQQRITNQQMTLNLHDLTADKSFGLLVATEIERIPEPEKSKRKQTITERL